MQKVLYDTDIIRVRITGRVLAHSEVIKKK
jgi:hypothetical protein